VRPSTEPTAPWEPLGIDADAEGRIAVTDASAGQRVLLLDATATPEMQIGGGVSIDAPGSIAVTLDYPNGVAIRGDELWVSDSNNRRVLVFDSRGALERLIRIDGIARGLAFLDSEEPSSAMLAVVDPLGSEILVLRQDGTVAARFGGPGSAAGRLAYPNDVAFDAGSQRLYVADTGNARVQVWEVVPAEDADTGLLGGGDVPPISAMRLAGLLLLGVGLALAGVGLWQLRPRARHEAGDLS
jgi:sugar lactone lactonase YvrE